MAGEVIQEGRLPNFLVIGVAKAGTTSLYHYLGQHPDIFMSPVKEPRFFAFEDHPPAFTGPGDERMREETTTTVDGYSRLFDGVRGERATGEASVVYLPHPGTARAIAQRLPDVKVVALLRDPTERAYSAYLYLRRDGYEACETFEEGLAAEPGRIADGWYYRWHYRGQGFYHRNLAQYYETFASSQIHVCLHEDLDRDPHLVLADLFRFLDVDDGFRPDVRRRHNPSGGPRSARAQRLLTGRHPVKEAVKKVVPEDWGHRLIALALPANLVRPPVAAKTRAELVAGYAEDVKRLEERIDRDLSHWLQ